MFAFYLLNTEESEITYQENGKDYEVLLKLVSEDKEITKTYNVTKILDVLTLLIDDKKPYEIYQEKFVRCFESLIEDATFYDTLKMDQEYYLAFFRKVFMTLTHPEKIKFTEALNSLKEQFIIVLSETFRKILR